MKKISMIKDMFNNAFRRPVKNKQVDHKSDLQQRLQLVANKGKKKK